MPYVMVNRLDSAAVGAARSHFLRSSSFDAELVAVGSFTEHVWLAPEPRQAFVDLIRATCQRFPESDYGSRFPNPVPHLTVGQVSRDTSIDELVGAAERDLAPILPIRFRVDAATLLEEQPDGSWATRERLPLG